MFFRNNMRLSDLAESPIVVALHLLWTQGRAGPLFIDVRVEPEITCLFNYFEF